jgi:anti-sigma regulatory factor (Ser/Thr protein kinase)
MRSHGKEIPYRKAVTTGYECFGAFRFGTDAGAMMGRATLTTQAGRDGLAKAMDFVEAELIRKNLPAKIHADILVATEEIFSNIAKYAYPPDTEGVVVLSVSVGGEAVIRFEDAGQPYNPLETANPNLDVPLTEREIGGLGVYFVKNLMDRVEYEFADGKNILTVTKVLSTPGPGGGE